MHLHALELHGFKTFATPTRMEFSPRVTAIVGPNGAGKSNIVDALRWALGETSFQRLRARKTDDLIFAGAPGRARAGMASVTLLLDNHDGALPVDFTEVALTRRAYRDGQSEFLLNGQRVRLRDIKELLAQAGLSEGAHVFIGQGMVDALLSLRPEDRRALFEEAAGIGLVRQRREEALRRLDATRRNMERARDLLAELEPRLRRLERRVQRARDMEALQNDLRQHLRVWYGYRWQQAVAEVEAARDAHQRAEAQWEEARARLQSLEQEQQTRFERIRDLREARRAQVDQIREAQKTWQTHDQRRQHAEEQLRELERRRAVWQAELTRAQETLAFREEEVQALEAQVVQRETAWREALQAREQAQTALKNARAARKTAQHALEQARQEVQRLTGRQAELQAQQRSLGREVREADRRLQQQAQRLQDLEAQLQAAAQVLRQAEGEHRRAREAYRAAQQALEQAQARVAQARDAARRMQQALDALRARRQRLQARLEGLRQAERDLVGYGDAARFVVRRVRDRVRGLLGPYLAVDETHETAIAAALDLWAETVLVEHDPQALLETAQAAPGRVMLLPARPHGAKPPPLPSDPGLLGRAVDLVRVAPEAQAAAEALLGWVWVARNADAARRARDNAPPGVWIVTLDGAAFGPQGGVVVGRPKGRHVLQRTRERQALEAELAALDQELAELEAQMKTHTAAVQTAAETLAQRQTAFRTAERETRVAHESWQKARLTHEQHRQAHELRQHQQAETQARLERLCAEQHQVEVEQQRIAQDLQAARETLRARQRALAALDLEEARREAAYWETQVAVASQARQELQNRLSAAQHAVAEARQRLADLSQQRQSWQRAWRQAQTTLHDAQTRSREVWSQIQDLQARLEPLEAELQALEAQHAAGQAALQDIRAAAQRAEQRAIQARLTLERARDRLQHLQRRIHEDFGPVALEAPAWVWHTQPLPLEEDVERLPRVDEVPPDLEDTIRRLRGRLRRLGPPPGPELRQEYETLAQRIAFLREQLSDLQRADAHLRELLAELDTTMRRQFQRTFHAVNRVFGALFTRLFGGGQARLVLLADDEGRAQGVDIDVRLPGKRTQRLAVLSGGERSLTAVALIFALLQVSPTPFCVLDEVDAMLDEANVARFGELLRELSRETQFVIITHNRHTVQIADVLYGVTLRDDGTSQVLSVNLADVDSHLLASDEVAA